MAYCCDDCCDELFVLLVFLGENKLNNQCFFMLKLFPHLNDRDRSTKQRVVFIRGVENKN